MRNVVLILSAVALLAFPSALAEETGAGSPQPAAQTSAGQVDVTLYAPDLSPILDLIQLEVDPKHLPEAILPGHPCLPDLSPCFGDVVCPYQGGYGWLPVATPPSGVGIMVGPPAPGFGPWFGPYVGVGVSTDGGC